MFLNLLNNIVVTVNDFIWSKLLIVLLISIGLFFSFRTKFVQVRYIKEMFRLLGDGFGKKSESSKHSISSFQAFCISTASRVGTGNIAGVALAITAGGPGAAFWMWLIAIIGSASSFIESTLAQLYKEKNGKAFVGGPAFYMEKGLKKRWMGILFSILITVCFGFIFNAVQANTISSSFNSSFGVPTLTVGIILSILTLVIIFGGVHRIAKVSEIIVPILAILYIAVALFVFFKNIGQVPEMFKSIFENAFDFKQMAAGALGQTISMGIKRGLFSNEAGMGSAPNAAATATVSHPVKQGLIQTLGVFTDTLIICSCTVFLILLSGAPLDGSVKGIELTQLALTNQIGSFGGLFLTVCIFLFAFSSIVGNYYYGQSNIEFFSKNKLVLNVYRVLVAAMVLFGSLTSIELVWNMADLFMGIMAIVNLTAIVLLNKHAITLLKDYTAQKKAGILEPVFDSSKFDEFKSLTVWSKEDSNKEDVA